MAEEKIKKEEEKEPEGFFKRVQDFVLRNLNAIIVVALVALIVAAFIIWRRVEATKAEHEAWYALAALAGELDAVGADDFRSFKAKFSTSATDPWVALHIVRKLIDEGKHEEARQEAGILISLYPDHEAAALSRELLSILEKEGEWSRNPKEFPRAPEPPKSEGTTPEGTGEGEKPGDATGAEEEEQGETTASGGTGESATPSSEEPSETATVAGEPPWTATGVDETASLLPRVRLDTDVGSIVLELFEDAAPNTVANFIHLVEKGFYNDLLFVRADGNIVQAGCPENSGQGGPGYSIRAEMSPNLTHGEGSLAMARFQDREMIEEGKPERPEYMDTAGSQFYIALKSLPHLDGKFAVFGRVVEGMEVVRSVTSGTKILKAYIVRKRPHEYVPETIPEKE